MASITIKEFQRGGIIARLTEGCAVNVYFISKQGLPVYSHSLKPSAVKLHADLESPLFQEIVSSQEWIDLNHAKTIERERQKVAEQSARYMNKAQATLQAAIDQLKLTGMTEDQARKVLGLAS